MTVESSGPPGKPTPAELVDLASIAKDEGISLEAAIDRYAWQQVFGNAVRRVMEAKLTQTPLLARQFEIVLPGDVRLALGDSIHGGGGFLTPPLPDNTPEIPASCSVGKEIVFVSSIEDGG